MKRYGVSRLLWALAMLAIGAGLVWFSGWWYTTARQPYLTQHPTTVAVAGATSLPVDKEAAQRYGVLSAARTMDGSGQPGGYVIVTAIQGYKSVIQVQCTFAADGSTLAGVRVVSQDETEYLGTRITSESFLEPFTGRRLPMKLWTSAAFGSPVDGLSGSTISAQAVVDGVNNAYGFLQDYLAA